MSICVASSITSIVPAATTTTTLPEEEYPCLHYHYYHHGRSLCPTLLTAPEEDKHIYHYTITTTAPGEEYAYYTVNNGMQHTNAPHEERNVCSYTYCH